jgi:hypothetical protein
LRQQMFGSLNTVTDEEFMSVYQTTGIEVDGRKELVQHRFRTCTDEEIKRHVKFMKAIPGFSQLPIEDQTALVKGEDGILLISFMEFLTQLQLCLMVHALVAEALSTFTFLVSSTRQTETLRLIKMNLAS